jgi:TonB-dependent starch-binding outer membrane protein SusC
MKSNRFLNSLVCWGKLIMTINAFCFCLISPNISHANDNALQDKKLIKGVVTDQKTSNSLPGLTVVVKGSTIGTITDIDGKFSIMASEKDVLEFSFIGYAKKEVVVGNQTTLNITMSEDVMGLDEVVVTGYGVQKKSDLTGSIASVGSQKLTEMPAISVDQALQGRAAGVSVTQNTGIPGGQVSIQIRGISSINGTEPLVIVDGVRGSLSNMNPGDIESVEILKDASSAAIYGSSGGNGVILVTTKKGKSGKLSTQFSHYSGWQSPWKKMDMMNSQELAEMLNYSNAMKGKDPFTTKPDTLPNYDWQDIMFRNALMQNYDLSISGGSEKSTFFVSANYQKQDGILRKSDYNRFGIRINSTHQVSKYIKIGENAQFTKTRNNGYEEWEFQDEYNTPLTAIFNMYPFLSPYDANGEWTQNPTGGRNPKVAEDILNKHRDAYSIGGNAFIEINPFKGFIFTSKVNGYVNFNLSSEFNKVYHYNTTTYNEHSKIIKSNTTEYGWEMQNYFNYNTTIAQNHNIGVMGGFEARRSKNESMRGQRLDLINETPEMQYFDASTDGSSSTQIITGRGWEEASFAYFGRINYDYRGKYLVTANIRNDHSSRFGPAHRSGVFPSFSFGWKFSEEEFIKNMNFINFGKLRFGYGETGANAPERYAYYASVNSTSNAFKYIFDQSSTASSGATLQKIPNTEMHWETMIMSNVGVDLGFLGNRLNLSVDLFKKENDGMLINQILPSIAGMYIGNNLVQTFGGDANPTTNIGKFENMGVETTIGYKIVGKLKANFDLNFTYIKNKVVDISGDSLYSGRNGVSLQDFLLTSEGWPVSQFNGFITDGLYTEDDAIIDSKGRTIIYRLTSTGDTVLQKKGILPGDLKFSDLNGDGKITNADKTNIGSPVPKFIFGFSTNLEYENFDLNIFFEGKFGHKIFNGTNWWLMEQTISGNRLKLMLDQYREPIEDVLGKTLQGKTNTTLPRFDPADPNGNFTHVSDFYVENGNYIRLKNIQLGYNFDNKLISKIGLSKLRIYVGAKNLLTFTKYSGFDPEIASSNMLTQGIDKAGNYPQSRVYLVGINIEF